MQKEGSPVFLRYHQGSVRGVSFSPRDRYLFCSGAYDGKVNLYTAQHMELLMCYQIASMGMTRNINAVRFTSDGSRILAATTARRLAVIDVERGEQVMTYDNCAYDTKDRASLAADPICPNMAVCSSANGKVQMRSTSLSLQQRSIANHAARRAKRPCCWIQFAIYS
uniref:Wd40 domain protein n=1 Tax=Rhipicephalus appendiculatus TaxID=34631 RepID=A0A131YP65_RHIAP